MHGVKNVIFLAKAHVGFRVFSQVVGEPGRAPLLAANPEKKRRRWFLIGDDRLPGLVAHTDGEAGCRWREGTKVIHGRTPSLFEAFVVEPGGARAERPGHAIGRLDPNRKNRHKGCTFSSRYGPIAVLRVFCGVRTMG